MSNAALTTVLVIAAGTGGTGHLITLFEEPTERVEWRALRNPRKWIADLKLKDLRFPKEPTQKPEPLRVAILNRMAGARHFSSLNHSVMRRARSGLPARHRYYQGDF